VAKSQIPNPMQRRHEIEKNLSEAASLELAEAYVAEGRLSESVVFFVKANADERLDALRGGAVESGDAFLLKQIADATRREPGADVWLRLSEAATRAGKDRYAEMARRHARSSED
jgi:hypothetical protein